MEPREKTKTATAAAAEATSEDNTVKAADGAKDGTEKKPDAPVLYIGPYLRRIASPGPVDTNGLPPILKAAIQENPVLKELLIPLSKAPAARRQLEVEGSAMNLFYQKAKEFDYSEVNK